MEHVQLIPVRAKSYCENCGKPLPNSGADHKCDDVVAPDLWLSAA